MSAPATYKGVLREYDKQPKLVRESFPHLRKLVEEFPLEVAIAYLFSQVELTHNVLLYCGVAKLHRAQVVVADRIIQATHITRESFQELFKTVFGKAMNETSKKLLEKAEFLRDKVMHGKTLKEAKKREAIVLVLKYATALNKQTKKLADLRAFSPDLRGFKGRGEALDASTTRWLLKGMGFTAS